MTYAAAAAMLDPLIHHDRRGIELVSWCCRDTTSPVVPQRELPLVYYITKGTVKDTSEWPDLHLGLSSGASARWSWGVSLPPPPVQGCVH